MRPIDADALYNRMMSTPTDLHYPSWYGDMVKKEPTIDPVKHGHWISNEDPFDTWRCSKCRISVFKTRYRYCPNCGTKMDKVTD